MPRLIHLLATLSIFVLPLPGVESQDESRSASNSRSTSDGGTTLPTVSPTEIDPATFCSMVFDNVGPFCQFVAPNNGPCLDEFSDTTCDSCTNILNSCGTFNGDICLSSLASSCPQSEEFLMDYCLVVDNTCMGPGVVNDFREPEEPSGDGLSGNNGPGVSGSGSTSGDGGAGPEAGGLSGSGESGGPPFQGSGNSSNGGDGDTGPAPSTPVGHVCYRVAFSVRIACVLFSHAAKSTSTGEQSISNRAAKGKHCHYWFHRNKCKKDSLSQCSY